MTTELQALNRAHQLFAAGASAPVPLAGPDGRMLHRAAEPNIGAGQARYRMALIESRDALQSAEHADAGFTRVIAAAYRDHAVAREQTKGVVDEARADTAAPGTPLAQRELLRRRAARLRAQHGHVLSAYRRARQHRATVQALGYRTSRRRRGRRTGLRLPAPNSRAGIAVRAALSRLGRPYVWGATGPSQFDCSGLTQWSYAQAGLHLDRTTYQQIHDGFAVPRSQVRPGDLVFPNPGHVQLAIGNNLVVEAPHAGAAVRIVPLGSNVEIRRPR